METFETAITWDRFAAFHAAVMEATEAAAPARLWPRHGLLPLQLCVSGRAGAVLHGARPGSARFRTRAVGRDQGGRLGRPDRRRRDYHAPLRRRSVPPSLVYNQERPPLLAKAYGAVRRALDPAGIMNPGVLIDLLPSWMARAMSSLDGRDEHFIASIVFQTAGQCWIGCWSAAIASAAHLTKFL